MANGDCPRGVENRVRIENNRDEISELKAIVKQVVKEQGEMKLAHLKLAWTVGAICSVGVVVLEKLAKYLPSILPPL